MYLVRVTGISRVISNLVIGTLIIVSVESLAFLGLDPPVVVAVSFLLTIFYVEPLDGSVGRAYPATWVTKPPCPR